MARPTDTQRMSDREMNRYIKKLPKEVQELLEHRKAGRKDPVHFAEHLLGIMLHDGQKLWLWMTTKTQTDLAFEVGLKLGKWPDREGFNSLRESNPDMLKNILVPSNRWGKTLVTTVKHLWFNFYKIGVDGKPEDILATRCGTLNLSPHSNQCQAAYDYVEDILTSKFTFQVLEPNPLYRADSGPDTPEMISVSYRNKCLIEDFLVGSNSQKRLHSFKNNTTFKAVPTGEDQGSSLAGTRYLYISYDECAQSLHLKEELPAKIMSRLIDFGGPLDLVSTPEVDKPSHQYFFHISKLGLKGADGWWTLIGKIDDNIFLRAKEVQQITDAIKSTDPVKYRQVKYGEFVTTGKKMFDLLLVERLWTGFTPDFVKVGRKYIVSADWGFSDTGDPSVFYVIDYTELLDEKIPKHLRKMYVVFRESIRGGSPVAVLTQAKMLQREWNDALFIHDSSAMGGVIIKKLLREMEMHNLIDFSASGDKMNMLFSLINSMSANRSVEIDSENKIIDKNPDFGILRSYYISELESQMGNYQYNPEKGVTDKKLEQDEIMSLGMGVWYLTTKILNIKAPPAVSFNPLAPTAEGVFGEKAAQALRMHTLTVPEKRIF